MRNSAAGRIAGIFGWPVAHSRSPLLHGYWLDYHGIDGAYVPLTVEPEHFHQALRMLPRLGFVGANVTVPHKEAALEVVDEADPLARRIGAGEYGCGSRRRHPSRFQYGCLWLYRKPPPVRA